ncbi:MAG: hypothetical protein QGG64_25920 [Candidatus Latescibacteria bacterium]|nr:hypothetical protein [Candidatus Latescibacterota bacterium]
MAVSLDAELGRREFARGVVRYLALGALATLTGILYSRSRSAEACINLEICNGCSAFRGCGLPPAVSIRAEAKEDINAG